MPIDTRTDIAELDLPELEAALAALGRPRFHARQIFQWIHRRGVTDFAAMSDLGRELRAQLARDFRIATPDGRQRERSTDGTTKFLLRLADGKLIESVYIPIRSDTPARSSTFCISTQVGCAMRCAFCLTGKMGIDRNLTAGEIVGQVRVLARELGMLDQPLQHRADGHGRAAAQLRRDDEGAADARPTSTGWRCRRGGSRSRPSACCRRSSGWRPSR